MILLSGVLIIDKVATILLTSDFSALVNLDTFLF